MSDIEQQIAQWRAGLAQSQTVNAADIDELETHLREEIGRLQTTDLSQVEAFLVARHRLGDTCGLADEFRKINGDWRSFQRLSWIALGVLVYLLGRYVVLGVSQSSILMASAFGVSGYGLGIIGLSAQVAATAALVALAYTITLRWNRGNSNAIFAKPRPILLLLALGVVNLALLAGYLIPQVMSARLLAAEEFGRIAFISGYGKMAWCILAPLVFAGVAMALRARGQRWREAGTAGPSE